MQVFAPSAVTANGSHKNNQSTGDWVPLRQDMVVQTWALYTRNIAARKASGVLLDQLKQQLRVTFVCDGRHCEMTPAYAALWREEIMNKFLSDAVASILTVGLVPFVIGVNEYGDELPRVLPLVGGGHSVELRWSSKLKSTEYRVVKSGGHSNGGGAVAAEVISRRGIRAQVLSGYGSDPLLDGTLTTALSTLVESALRLARKIDWANDAWQRNTHPVMITQRAPADNGAAPRHNGAETGLHSDDMWVRGTAQDYVGSHDAVVASMQERAYQDSAAFLLYNAQMREREEASHLNQALRGGGTSAATRIGLSDRDFIDQGATASRQARELVNEARELLPSGVQMAQSPPMASLPEDLRALERDIHQQIGQALGVPDRFMTTSSLDSASTVAKGSFETATAALSATVAKWQRDLEPLLQNVYDVIWRRYDEAYAFRAIIRRLDFDREPFTEEELFADAAALAQQTSRVQIKLENGGAISQQQIDYLHSHGLISWDEYRAKSLRAAGITADDSFQTDADRHQPYSIAEKKAMLRNAYDAATPAPTTQKQTSTTSLGVAQ